MSELKLNPEIDTTKFVNIYEKKFVFHINNQPREIESGETKIMPVYVAQIGAKHLVDLILQSKHGIKDTLRDTPLRKSLFAEILPEMAEQLEVTPLSKEEELAEIKKQVDKQNETIKSFMESSKENEAKDKRIAELETKLETLSKKFSEMEVPQTTQETVLGVRRPGRPKKVAE